MSFRVVRQSKFRHIYGSNWKREQCFDNIRVSKAAWDSLYCSVNPKFLAVIVESGGGGAFLVIPHSKNGRLSPDVPLVAGHKGPVLDIAWCPHNDNVIASASEDCSVKVWEIPDGGLNRALTDCKVNLLKHQRRVGIILWHPSAENVLLSAGADNQVVIWDVGTAQTLFVFSMPDLIYSGCWNWDGSDLIFTCKDRKIRRVNPRSGEIEEEAIAHESNKASRAIFLKNGLVFTTGFTKQSERQYSLRAPGHLDDPIVMVELDTSNGVMFPMYDPDSNLIYLCGKGDSVIRYFEITPEPPFVHYINTFQTPDPQRAIGMMCKRGCDVSICEMSRFYRLNNNGFCQVVSFVVPRKSEMFQEDLYPPTQANVPAISALDWARGQNTDPILFEMSSQGVVYDNEPKRELSKSEVSDNASSGGLGSRLGDSRQTSKAPSPAAVSAKESQPSENVVETVMKEVNSVLNEVMKKNKDDVTELTNEIRKLKSMIVKHESRIRCLEMKNQMLEEKLATAGNGDQMESQILDSNEV